MKIFGYKHFNLLFFSGSFIVLFLIYFSAHRAMLIDDGISGIWEIKTEGLPGYLRSYGFENFYYGHYGIVAVLYALFGLNALGWYVFFVGMHALNTTLLFMVCKKIFSNTNTENRSGWMALCSALLFLLSPYQSENIVWAATSHYCSTLFILLISALWLIRKIEGNTTIPYVIFHVLFAFALVTLEISFLFSLILSGVYLLYRSFPNNHISWPDFILKFAVPQFVLIFIYCLLHKLLFHSWIPHDRATEDTVFSFSHAITTLTQQMVKLFGFIHFLDFSKRESVYLSFHWKKVLAVLVFIFGIISVFLWKKSRQHFYTAVFFVMGALLMYAPFMRLYFMYLARIENDRYNYFASAFLFSFFVFLLFQMHRFIRISVIILYIVAFVICLFPVVSARKHSAALHSQYLSQLSADTTSGKIYLLNVPATCRDAYMFRAEARLGIALQVIYHQNKFDKLVQVAWYNAQSEHDAFEVKKISDSSYHVQIKTGGSWWMYQSIGASDLENESYRFELDQWGGYLLTFKTRLLPDDAILLYNRGKFVKVK